MEKITASIIVGYHLIYKHGIIYSLQFFIVAIENHD